jgi:nicotinamide-nucleotide amidase
MSELLDAWILTIGNEIINSVITDTNRETISRELRSVGITVRGMSSVGDDVELIADALDQAMSRARITIVSGGLGPTEDDKTAEGAAKFLGLGLHKDNQQMARIEERFKQWGRSMSPSNAKQAMFPEGAAPISNDYGTAPGFLVEKNSHIALFFPGVPRELVNMIRDQGLPMILDRFGDTRKVFRTRTLIVYGMSESRIGEILADVAQDQHDYHLAFLPRFPVIRLRIDANASNAEDAEKLMDSKQRILEKRLGENIISSDGRSMEEIVLKLLENQGYTITLAESITGGMIGEMLTRVPGSSRCFMGSVVSYSNEMKMKVLGVSESTLASSGAVSHECAREMAIGAMNVGNSSMGLSVTGIAGPDGGTPNKPVGTLYVGMAAAEGVTSRKFLLPGSREWIRTLSAMQALDMVRRRLLGYRLHGEE